MYRKKLLKSVQIFPLSRPHKKSNNLEEIHFEKLLEKHLRTLDILHEHSVLLVLDHSNCFPPLFAQNLKLKSKSERKQQKFNRIISFFITPDYSTKSRIKNTRITKS